MKGISPNLHGLGGNTEFLLSSWKRSKDNGLGMSALIQPTAYETYTGNMYT